MAANFAISCNYKESLTREGPPIAELKSGIFKLMKKW